MAIPTVPPSEKFRVLRLVRRESTASAAVCSNANSQTVHFSNAQGSLRVVDEQEVRSLARESTRALLNALATSDDTAKI